MIKRTAKRNRERERERERENPPVTQLLRSTCVSVCVSVFITHTHTHTPTVGHCSCRGVNPLPSPPATPPVHPPPRRRQRPSRIRFRRSAHANEAVAQRPYLIGCDAEVVVVVVVVVVLVSAVAGKANRMRELTRTDDETRVDAQNNEGLRDGER